MDFFKVAYPISNNNKQQLKLKMNWLTFQGDNYHSSFASLLKKLVYPKRNKCAHHGGSKFIPFRVDPFFREAFVYRKINRKSQISSTLYQMAKKKKKKKKMQGK